MSAAADGCWHPVAALDDLPYRHVFRGKLHGLELAIWRADDDTVNVWENRCLHRGMRLSAGSNNGAELKCSYHGWRYASGTAACIYIPAHPVDAPARTIHNRVFAVSEHAGLVWTNFEQDVQSTADADLACADALVLRALPFAAAPDLVSRRLPRYVFQPVGRLDDVGASIEVLAPDSFKAVLRSNTGSESSRVVLIVQPVDADSCIVRGLLAEGADTAHRTAILRHHSDALEQFRSDIEAEARSLPRPPPLEPQISAVPVEVEAFAGRGSRDALQRVRVARKYRAATGIVGIELVPVTGRLAAFRPGAHIDVHLGNGLVRQYSLTSGPGETDTYRIGVKLEPDSRGGSAFVHDSLREGDLLAVSVPRNSFTLRRDGVKSILVAGGIGITPLMSMAQTLRRDGREYELHCFVQTFDHLAFPDDVVSHADAATVHCGLNPQATASQLRIILHGPEPDWHLYVCGPAPMLAAAREIAAELGWPDARVHYEYFKNPNVIESSSSFDVALARSGVTLRVQAGESILEVLRRGGLNIPSSCEQGACGTCRVAVIEGTPDHQDVRLNATERKAGDVIMTCVSRSLSDRLVLDV